MGVQRTPNTLMEMKVSLEFRAKWLCDTAISLRIASLNIKDGSTYLFKPRGVLEEKRLARNVVRNRIQTYPP